MKWITSPTFPKCQITTDFKLLKADCIEDLPNSIKAVFTFGYTDHRYNVDQGTYKPYSRALYKDLSTKHGKEFVGLRFRSSGGYGAVYKESLIKRYLSLGNRFYVPHENGILLIKNEKYVIIAAPVPSVELITFLSQSTK